MRSSVKETVWAFRVTRQQRLRHGQTADRHDGRLLQEGATVDAPMAVFVVEIIDALVDLALGQRRRRFPRSMG